MYMERSGALLPYDCWSLIARITKKMEKHDRNSENATLFEFFDKMNSYIKESTKKHASFSILSL